MTVYDPKKHHRRSIRLKDYDYSQAGAYFVTVCTRDRQCLLATMTGDTAVPTEIGCLVQSAWHELRQHYAHVELDKFVVMPNHLHGIIVLTDDGRRGGVGVRVGAAGAGFKLPESHRENERPIRHGLPEIVRALKTFSARRINSLLGTPSVPFWQRNYYEHVIRNEKEWDEIAAYTADNPLNWATDPDNPLSVAPSDATRHMPRDAAHPVERDHRAPPHHQTDDKRL